MLAVASLESLKEHRLMTIFTCKVCHHIEYIYNFSIGTIPEQITCRFEGCLGMKYRDRTWEYKIPNTQIMTGDRAFVPPNKERVQKIGLKHASEVIKREHYITDEDYEKALYCVTEKIITDFLKYNIELVRFGMQGEIEDVQ